MEIIKCPNCGQSVNKRKIQLFDGMVKALRSVYMWCGEHKRHEFSRKDVKHLFLDENQSARFGDWVYFGGILYKRSRGQWGMHMGRARAFLNGFDSINTICVKDPLKHEHELSDKRFVYQIKGLRDFLSNHGNFVPEYE